VRGRGLVAALTRGALSAGKFFKASYATHVKRCQEKFALQHTQCERCLRYINNSDWGASRRAR
jgi:hypothetical protein